MVINSLRLSQPNAKRGFIYQQRKSCRKLYRGLPMLLVGVLAAVSMFASVFLAWDPMSVVNQEPAVDLVATYT
jgi:hypothetical protein